MTKKKAKLAGMDLLQAVYDSYPDSDLLAVTMPAAISDPAAYHRQINRQKFGDGLFRFLIGELFEGDQVAPLGTAIARVSQAVHDLSCVAKRLARELDTL